MSDEALDPLVAVCAWLLTQVLAWMQQRVGFDERWRAWLPYLAVVLALFLRTTATALAGQPLTWEALWHGLAAGVAAVGGHVLTRPAREAMANQDPPAVS